MCEEKEKDDLNDKTSYTLWKQKIKKSTREKEETLSLLTRFSSGECFSV